MSAAWAIFSFELRRGLRQPATWIYFAVFFFAAMMWTLAAGGAFPRVAVSFGSDKLFVNAPMALAAMVGMLAVFALPVISSVMGRAVQQDFEARVQDSFFTTPISKAAYLGGRFAAALTLLLGVLTSLALGARFALALPLIDGARQGDVGVAPYLWPYVILVVPNLILLGAVFFTLGALTRRMLPVYLVSAVLLVGYLIGSELGASLDHKLAAALADPFGVIAALQLSEYWSVTERNTRLLPLEGAFLANRVLWLALASAGLAWTYRRFSFTAAEGKRKRRDSAPAASAAAPAPAPAAPPPTRAAEIRPRPVALLGALAWMQLRETVKNVYFGVIALIGVLFVTSSSVDLGAIFGTSTYPVTYLVLDLVSGQFSIFILILITYYGGELVWRERDHRIDQLHDALPLPTALPMLAKLLALMAVPAIMQGVVMLTGIAIQLAHGYTRLELGLYLHHLFGIQLVNYWALCALVLAVHALVNQKALGHFAMVVYFVVTAFSSWLGLEHRLLRPFQVGTPTYSDMNGYGDLLERTRWLQATWLLLALALLVVARLFWQRGTSRGWRSRLAIARSRLVTPVLALGVLALVGFGASAGVVYHNTNRLNVYRSSSDTRALAARYEKTYRARLVDVPQARLTAVDLAVDLYPSQHRLAARGTLTLSNKGSRPVEEVWINLPQEATVTRLELDRPHQVAHEDRELGMRALRLTPPLAPGERTALAVELTWGQHGFRNENDFHAIVENGTFVNNRQFLPSFGYREEFELVTDSDRRTEGLSPKDRLPPRTDPAGLARNYLTSDADWIDFRTVVSTEADQLAIAPGYLQKEWRDGDRRFFEYEMDSPILPFFAYLSARYQVHRDRWNDVAIEIFYHPGHEYNLDRMVAATKDSLEYFTRAFGPYQHRQFRILEFPRYERFAQAFPNTIPYSESIGFIARVDDQDEDDLDYPYYVTSHELAHQWWAHQVIGANVQGATFLSETLAQYSALMVMKRRYGEAKMKRFMRFELERYLTGRSTENKREVPLAMVEDQPYVHYAKGSLVMYALQDTLGEETVNRAIRSFLEATAYKGPPYPTSDALVQRFREVAGPAHAELIEDLFERIVLYENRAIEARAKKLPSGRYEVTLVVRAKKLRADELGAQTEVPLQQQIDLGVLGAGGKPLYLAKHPLASGEHTLRLEVDGEPVQAGIDPLNKLIDRAPRDNLVDVER